MSNVPETLALAWQYHQSRSFAQAEHLCRQVLAADATQADAWYLLGKAVQAQGRLGEAIGHYRQALQYRPEAAEVYGDLGIALANSGHLDAATDTFREGLRRAPNNANAANNLGVILAMQARPQEAIEFFQKAALLQPANADFHVNLGNAFCDCGRFDEGVANYRQSLQFSPHSPSGHTGLGNALRQLGQPEAAEAHFRECLRAAPNYVKAWHGLGTTLAEQKKYEEAVACFRQALQHKPDFAEAHHGLGMALADQLQLDQAIACYRQALRWKPDFAEAFNNQGNALLLLEKPDEAVASYKKAISILPTFSQAHKNLGNALYSQGKLDLAVTHYDQALLHRHDYAEAHWNRSLVRLLVGDFENGWPEYEWRWTQPGFDRRDFAQPRWDGAPLGGRAILLYAEQGLGDTIQFVRYAALAKQAGGHVIVECQPPLMRLLTGVGGIDRLVPRGYPLPPFDVQSPLLSLPGILHTNLDNIPAQPAYLTAEPELTMHWQRELHGLSGFKIGIVWQGSKSHPGDRRRSIPLTQFAPLTHVDGSRLVSLQIGPGTEQLPGAAPLVSVLDLANRLGNITESFANIAAVMKGLDLVICCDTAIGHLAGALGVPVWVAVALVPDWRWLLERDDSPWYPSMRLFRQTRYGQWQDIFERMADRLRNLAIPTQDVSTEHR